MHEFACCLHMKNALITFFVILYCHSHELRTPMAAVIGLLDILMSDDCLNNEQQAMITQIRKCSNALLRLLNNILDISKVECDKILIFQRMVATI